VFTIREDGQSLLNKVVLFPESDEPFIPQGRVAVRELVEKFSLAIASILLMGAVFCLGFIGEPENNPELNESELWGPGDPFYGRKFFLADPLLIWRARPNYRGPHGYQFSGATINIELNNLGLHDDEVTPKKQGDVRILNIGDSATWGLNLTRRADNYSDQLEKILNQQADPKTHYEVINAGIIGYSSLQGAEFLRVLLDELELDAVTVFFGNNDSAPGGRDLDRVSTLAKGPFHFLFRNWFFLKLRKFYHDLKAKTKTKSLKDEPAPQNPNFPVSRKEYLESPFLRVSPEQYEKNLRAIVRMCRDQGVRVVLLKVPKNQFWPPLAQPEGGKPKVGSFFEQVRKLRKSWWSATSTEEGYLDPSRKGPVCRNQQPLQNHPYLCLRAVEDFGALAKFASENGFTNVRALLVEDSRNPDLPFAARYRALNNLSVWETINGRYREGESYARQIVDSADQGSDAPDDLVLRWAYYNLGIAEFLQGKKDAALKSLERQRAIFPFAMSPDYDQIFDLVVHELDVDWIDIPKIFGEADQEYFGSALIHDWVHPNRTGNRLIAEAIAARFISR
jgi:lysophospholipase L1-like esterase